MAQSEQGQYQCGHFKISFRLSPLGIRFTGSLNTAASIIAPVQVSHHEALEVGGHEAVERGPGEEPVLGPLRLVVGGHVELRVPQGHADVIQQPWQRPELEDGVLQRRQMAVKIKEQRRHVASTVFLPRRTVTNIIVADLAELTHDLPQQTVQHGQLPAEVNVALEATGIAPGVHVGDFVEELLHGAPFHLQELVHEIHVLLLWPKPAGDEDEREDLCLFEDDVLSHHLKFYTAR